MQNIGFIGQRYATQEHDYPHELLVNFFKKLLTERDVGQLVVSSGAGTDLAMIEAALHMGIDTEIVVPFSDHTERWPVQMAELYENVANGARKTVLRSEYARGVYDLRNRYITNAAQDALWIFWDGRNDYAMGGVLAMASAPGAVHVIENVAGVWAERRGQ